MTLPTTGFNLRANVYDIGDRPRLTATFSAVDPEDGIDVNVDPDTSVVFIVRRPDDVETTYTYGVDAAVVKDAVGIYHLDVSITMAGLWRVRCEGTGVVYQAAEEREITARERRVG